MRVVIPIVLGALLQGEAYAADPVLFVGDNPNVAIAQVVMELLDKSPDRREESAPGMARRLAEQADGAKRFGSVEAP